MGRRPNQVILQFFHRGNRLDDKSNRYKHTCKACGEDFPKGRLERLTSHLEHECQAISCQDRRRALFLLRDATTLLKPGNGDAQGHQVFGQGFHDMAANTGLGMERKLSGLEALAEASRQIEYPHGREEVDITQEAFLDHTSGGTCSNALLLNGTASATNQPGKLRKRGLNVCLYITKPDNFLAAISSLSMDARFLSAQAPMAHLTPPFSYAMDAPSLTTTAQDPSTLSLIAASASDLEALLPGLNQHISPNNDIQPNSVLNVRGLAQPARFERIPLAETSVHSASQPHSIAPSTNDGITNPSNGIAKMRKQKIRQKFSDSRRLEVQGIRKKGACIRCRMLRKTVGTSL